MAYYVSYEDKISSYIAKATLSSVKGRNCFILNDGENLTYYSLVSYEEAENVFQESLDKISTIYDRNQCLSRWKAIKSSIQKNPLLIQLKSFTQIAEVQDIARIAVVGVLLAGIIPSVASLAATVSRSSIESTAIKIATANMSTLDSATAAKAAACLAISPGKICLIAVGVVALASVATFFVVKDKYGRGYTESITYPSDLTLANFVDEDPLWGTSRIVVPFPVDADSIRIKYKLARLNLIRLPETTPGWRSYSTPGLSIKHTNDGIRMKPAFVCKDGGFNPEFYEQMLRRIQGGGSFFQALYGLYLCAKKGEAKIHKQTPHFFRLDQVSFFHDCMSTMALEKNFACTPSFATEVNNQFAYRDIGLNFSTLTIQSLHDVIINCCQYACYFYAAMMTANVSFESIADFVIYSNDDSKTDKIRRALKKAGKDSIYNLETIMDDWGTYFTVLYSMSINANDLRSPIAVEAISGYSEELWDMFINDFLWNHRSHLLGINEGHSFERWKGVWNKDSHRQFEHDFAEVVNDALHVGFVKKMITDVKDVKDQAVEVVHNWWDSISQFVAAKCADLSEMADKEIKKISK